MEKMIVIFIHEKIISWIWTFSLHLHFLETTEPGLISTTMWNYILLSAPVGLHKIILFIVCIKVLV